MKQLLILLVLLFAVTVTLWAENEAETREPNTVDLAKSFFEKMYAGDVSVTDQIDWENITVFDVDYHDEYLKLTDAKEIEDFKNALVINFIDDCNSQMLFPENLTDWKVHVDDDDYAIVSAEDYPFSMVMEFDKVGSKLILWCIRIDD